MSAGSAKIAGVDLDIDALMRLRLLSPRTGNRKLAASHSPQPGMIMHRRRGRGLETYDVRPWSDGDDIRLLDRNVTARLGTPHVRTFQDERGRAVLYLVDFRPSMFFGTRRAFRSVVAAEAVVFSAWRTLGLHGRVSLSAITSRGARFFGWAASARAFPLLLSELANAHREALGEADGEEPTLAEAIEAMEGVAGSAAMMIATALDAPGDRFDAIVEGIACKRILEVLLIADHFELAPPPGRYPYWTHDGATGQLTIARNSGAAETDERQARLRRLGARFLQIDAGLGMPETARVLERFDGRSF